MLSIRHEETLSCDQKPVRPEGDDRGNPGPNKPFFPGQKGQTFREAGHLHTN